MKFRAPFFVILAFLSLVQIGMAIWAAVALSGETSDIKNTAWTTIDIDESFGRIQAWIGLTHIVGERSDIPFLPDLEVTQNWDTFCKCAYETPNQGRDNDCFFFGNGTQTSIDNCAECQSASEGFYVAVITGILSKFGQLTTDLTRSTQKEDVPCQKTFGICTGIIGSIATLVALVTYRDSCWGNIPDEIYIPNQGLTLSTNAKAGIGYLMCLINTIFGLPDAFFHAIVPCPEDCSDPDFLKKREVQTTEQETTKSLEL